MMQPRPRDVTRSFRSDVVRRTYAELYCLGLVFVFHDHNSNSRKAATILTVATWAAIEVGAAFGLASLPNQFLFLRIVIGVLIGRMWGIEINNFAGLDIEYHDGDD